MVGGYALRYALANPAVGRVTSIGRKKLGISHPEADSRFCIQISQTVLHSQGRSRVRTQRSFAWARIPERCPMRTSARITVDYAIEFARVLRGSSPGAAFSFLSGVGADPTGRSRIPFAYFIRERPKRATRRGIPHVYLFRPAHIYPVEPRNNSNFSYRLLRRIHPVFRLLLPNQVIGADDLARVMVDVAVRGREEHRGPVFENRDIRAMALLITTTR